MPLSGEEVVRWRDRGDSRWVVFFACSCWPTRNVALLRDQSSSLHSFRGSRSAARPATLPSPVTHTPLAPRTTSLMNGRQVRTSGGRSAGPAGEDGVLVLAWGDEGDIYGRAPCVWLSAARRALISPPASVASLAHLRRPAAARVVLVCHRRSSEADVWSAERSWAASVRGLLNIEAGGVHFSLPAPTLGVRRVVLGFFCCFPRSLLPNRLPYCSRSSSSVLHPILGVPHITGRK